VKHPIGWLRALVLLWLYLMAFAVRFGAALNAELEHQTTRDTTAGPTRKEL
jgi:membrane protein